MFTCFLISFAVLCTILKEDCIYIFVIVYTIYGDKPQLQPHHPESHSHFPIPWPTDQSIRYTSHAILLSILSTCRINTEKGFATYTGSLVSNIHYNVQVHVIVTIRLPKHTCCSKMTLIHPYTSQCPASSIVCTGFHVFSALTCNLPAADQCSCRH